LNSKITKASKTSGALADNQSASAAAGGNQDTFRQLLEAAPDAIIVVDQSGTINLVNSMAEKNFGYRSDEIVGQPIEILVPSPFREQHIHHRQGYFDEPSTRPMGSGLELTGQRKDGSEFPAEISISPLTTDEGVLVTAVVRDITERKRTEQVLQKHATELERSNAELEQFAYVASHDLQEPLRIVASYTQLLSRRYKDQLDEDANEFIDFVVDAATRMQNLINDLLSYSRVGTRGQEFEPTNLNSVLESVLKNLDLRIKDNHATVTHDALPTVMADDRQFLQLFQNLIGNALKFRGEDPPQVHIGFTRQDEEYLFSVRDNGIGIDPQFVDRIFLVFQRLHGRGEYPGTGIGLAICKKIVERHGGRIWVESEPDAGSTFYFTVPVHREDG
jgi:PAS domain S-box-containing protein